MNSKKILLLAPTILGLGTLFGCNSTNKDIVDADWMIRDNWYELTNNATEANIGKKVTIKVNGRNHYVRLIGIDHDVDENGKKLHTTWEFANLISDKEGYSLSYQWNDTKNGNVASTNYDYINSTIRYALTGKGNNGGKEDDPHSAKGLVLVATKGSKSFDTGTYDKPIINMLPTELLNKIKTVKKTVGIRANDASDYIETSYTDKLFMLSGRELGNDSPLEEDKGCGTIYKYYENTNSTVLKNQVKNDFYTPLESISDVHSYYTGSIANHAGQHEGSFTCGGSYWTRSPFCNFQSYTTGEGTYCVTEVGAITFKEGYANAYGIAPAFCI